MTGRRQLIAIFDGLERRRRKDYATARAWLIHVSGGQDKPISAGPAADGDDRTMFTLLLDYEAVADELCISPRSVRRLVSSGALPAVSVGGNCRRVRRRDLEAYVSALEGTTTRMRPMHNLEDRSHG